MIDRRDLAHRRDIKTLSLLVNQNVDPAKARGDANLIPDEVAANAKDFVLNLVEPAWRGRWPQEIIRQHPWFDANFARLEELWTSYGY